MKSVLVVSLCVIALLFLCSSQLATAQNPKVYDLGAFPGGTWSEGRGINNFGIVVGKGDTPGTGTRPLMVPIFGPSAGKWNALGTLGGEMDADANGVSDTGLVIGFAGTSDGYVHGFAWTATAGMSDLGTLPDSGDLYSQAIAVNSSGTLIVGWSSAGYDWDGGGWGFTLPDYTAVVWTPIVSWQNGKLVTKWKINKLDQTGMEQYYGWYATGVNNRGQIVGRAWGDSGFVPVIWNPLPYGKGWKVQQLSCPQDFSICSTTSINDRDEISGFAYFNDWSYNIPAFWQPVRGSQNLWNFVQLQSLVTPAPGVLMDTSWMNNVGDIVGSGNDATANWVATRWTDKQPQFINLLGFPGAPSVVNRVNDFGIAVGAYLTKSSCWCAAAIHIPRDHN